MSEPNGNQKQNNAASKNGSNNSGGRRKRKRSGGNQGPQGKSNDHAKQNKGPRRKEPQVDPVDFWGDAEALPEPLDHIREAGDVKAVVQSLGRVPLNGQETAAEHWFALVYERAAVLAGALAAAGDLLADDDTA